uniref:Uncharacterized protein n=1 Tax=Arundo donax TaxID=35708 RepID=A0A0A8YYF9_ARUDO
MIVHTHKQPKWHVIQICFVHSFKCNNISKVFILHSTPRIGPYQCFNPSFLIRINHIHETRIIFSKLLKQLQGPFYIILCLFSIYLLVHSFQTSLGGGYI